MSGSHNNVRYDNKSVVSSCITGLWPSATWTVSVLQYHIKSLQNTTRQIYWQNKCLQPAAFPFQCSSRILCPGVKKTERKADHLYQFYMKYPKFGRWINAESSQYFNELIWRRELLDPVTCTVPIAQSTFRICTIAYQTHTAECRAAGVVQIKTVLLYVFIAALLPSILQILSTWELFDLRRTRKSARCKISTYRHNVEGIKSFDVCNSVSFSVWVMLYIYTYTCRCMSAGNAYERLPTLPASTT